MTKPRLLLVEDDRALADLLSWHFEREGYEIVRTADGEEALLLAQERTPDLVILDWMIEGVTGIEVCRRLRRKAPTAHVPIIMLTARGEETDRIRGLETGADDYVTKPFSPRELLARVGAVLRRVRPALAGDQLTYADIEMDVAGASRPPRRRSRCSSARPNSGCFAICSRIPGRVFSRERLLDAVWPHDSDIDVRTVDVHVRRLAPSVERGRAPGRGADRSLGRIFARPRSLIAVTKVKPCGHTPFARRA